MCKSCWEDAGSPAVTNPAVQLTAAVIAVVYRYSCVGGALHIMLDDWNLNDHFIHAKYHSLTFCDGAIEAPNRDDVTENQRKVERLCLSLMEHLSMDERASALALYNGFITQDDSIVLDGPDEEEDLGY